MYIFANQGYTFNGGGYSQCKYQQVLIEECLCSGKQYDRIFFLSGQDYPIWSNDRIESFLAEHPSSQFIMGMNISRCNNPRKIKEKLSLYHFFRDINVRSGKIKRILSGGSRIIMKLLPIRKKRYVVVNGKRCEIYQGSSWWCVTMDCLKEIHKGFTNQQWIGYFKYTFAPDEMMAQSIVFNSSFAKDAILYDSTIYPGLANLTPLHYIEYDKKINTYTIEDLPKLIESGKMFFRKAETGKSDRLLDAIDALRK